MDCHRGPLTEGDFDELPSLSRGAHEERSVDTLDPAVMDVAADDDVDIRLTGDRLIAPPVGTHHGEVVGRELVESRRDSFDGIGKRE
ncbi:MAG: hypothetical protein ABEJ35_03370 [Halobacteriaceae archaeon]